MIIRLTKTNVLLKSQGHIKSTNFNILEEKKNTSLIFNSVFESKPTQLKVSDCWVLSVI